MASRILRKKAIFAFQGEHGAYSEEAARTAHKGCKTIACSTFSDALAAVEAGTATHAIIPVENSTAGPVEGVRELLSKTKLKAVGEIILPVRHCLLTHSGQKIGDIRRVYSHPQALMQCKKTIEKMLPNARVFPCYDTAGAAKRISEIRPAGAAAIASSRAGRIYGLERLAEGIQDESSNSSRFCILSKEGTTPNHRLRHVQQNR